MKRIEVIRSSSAVDYGENAFQGAINIVTKLPQSANYTGSNIGLIIVLGEAVLNGIILKQEWIEINAALGLKVPNQIALTLAMIKLFSLGFISIWLYDVFTHKYGAGFKSSIRAGVFMAALLYEHKKT